MAEARHSVTGLALLPAPRIALSAIGAGNQPLGSGGQGIVYPMSLTADGHALVYKQYRRPHEIDASVLDAMVSFVRSLDDGTRHDFLNLFAWPVSVVENGPDVVGFLMPAVPDEFYVDFVTGARTQRIPAEFQHLLNSPAFLASHGILLSPRQQFELLESTATAITQLHRSRIAVGDLSPRNILFSLSGKPHVYFVDCDAMVINGATVADQVETPSWGVPVASGEARGTLASDAYKFGLLALRLLAGDHDTADPDRLPQHASSVRPLVQRMLTLPAAHRPTPDDWIPSLQIAANTASTQPLTKAAQLTGSAKPAADLTKNGPHPTNTSQRSPKKKHSPKPKQNHKQKQ